MFPINPRRPVVDEATTYGAPRRVYMKQRRRTHALESCWDAPDTEDMMWVKHEPDREDIMWVKHEPDREDIMWVKHEPDREDIMWVKHEPDREDIMWVLREHDSAYNVGLT